MDRTRTGGVRRRLIRYTPLKSQKRFHESRARFKGFSGPIGSGKSQALCQEAIRLAYLNPGRTGLIGAPTYPMLRDATQRSLLEVLAGNGIPYTHNKADGTLVLTDTRSRILLRSLDRYERLRGTNLAWFGIDELTYTNEEAWVRLEGRLRDPKATVLCGFAVWTPRGYDWVYHRFVKQQRPEFEVVYAKAAENRHLLEQVPDFYERLRGSYDERFYRQEVLGEYLNVCQDRVYYAFERGVHVRPQQIAVDLPLLWALDFNVDPMCSVVAQVRGRHVHVLDELVLQRATTRMACEEFVRRYHDKRGRLQVYGDASGARMQTTGMSDYQMVKRTLATLWQGDVEYRVPRFNPPVAERVQLVNSKLMPATREAEMWIDNACGELAKDLEEVAYSPGSSAVDKRNGARTHLSDALGYLLWQEFGERPTVGERDKRLF